MELTKVDTTDDLIANVQNMINEYVYKNGLLSKSDANSLRRIIRENQESETSWSGIGLKHERPYNPITGYTYPDNEVKKELDKYMGEFCGQFATEKQWSKAYRKIKENEKPITINFEVSYEYYPYEATTLVDNLS